MGLFNKLFGKKSTADDRNTVQNLPAQIPLIPGELDIHVFTHEAPMAEGQTLPCITYLTNGLASLGQKELFLCMETKASEKRYSQEPFAFFEQVAQLAKKGQTVDQGEISMLGGNGLMGWPGILYGPAAAGLDSDLQKQFLTMVLLNQEEVQSVETFGPTRILSSLGKQARYYPFPYWTRDTREALPIQEMTERSVLSQVGARFSMPEAGLTKQGEHIVLSIDSTFNTPIPREQLTTDITVLVFPGLDQEANACLTWNAHGPEPEAITRNNSDGSRAGGCFLLIVPGQEQNQTTMTEDGYGLLLTNEKWEALWDALVNRDSLEIPSDTESPGFSLQWREA